MPLNEPNFEALWKGQEREPMPMTAQQISLKAQSFEKKGEREYWLVLVVVAIFVAKSGYGFFQSSEPLARVGWASGITAFLYIGARWARRGPPAKFLAASQTQNCADFLRSELAKKRERLLEIRWTLLLLFPALSIGWWSGGPAALSVGWWGGAPAALAHRFGIDSWIIRFQESPVPLIGQVLILLVVWIKVGKEAQRVGRELNALDHQ
jgi:hypothetical protein